MLGLKVVFKEKAESTSVYKSSEEHRSGWKFLQTLASLPMAP